MDIVHHLIIVCKLFYSKLLQKKILFDFHLDATSIGMEQRAMNVNNFVYSIIKIILKFFMFIAICTPPCVNGNCTYADVCNCSTGWTDSTCSTREYYFNRN
jgi:hypothetical protein